MDLSNSAVAHYWQQRGADIANVVRSMDAKQHWAVDNDLYNLVYQLGLAMGMDPVRKIMMDNPKETAEFLAWLTSSRALPILQFLEDAELGSAAVIISAASDHPDNPALRVFVEGLQAMERAKVLHAVFNLERMAHISHLLKTKDAFFDE